MESQEHRSAAGAPFSESARQQLQNRIAENLLLWDEAVRRERRIVGGKSEEAAKGLRDALEQGFAEVLQFATDHESYLRQLLQTTGRLPDESPYSTEQASFWGTFFSAFNQVLHQTSWRLEQEFARRRASFDLLLPQECALCGRPMLTVKDRDRGCCHGCRDHKGKLAEASLAFALRDRWGSTDPVAALDHSPEWRRLRDAYRQTFDGERLDGKESLDRLTDWLREQGHAAGDTEDAAREAALRMTYGQVADLLLASSPKGLLSLIVAAEKECPTVESGLYSPQERIQDIWRAMRNLGIHPGDIPRLPIVTFVEKVKGEAPEKEAEQWRAYTDALAEARKLTWSKRYRDYERRCYLADRLPDSPERDAAFAELNAEYTALRSEPGAPRTAVVEPLVDALTRLQATLIFGGAGASETSRERWRLWLERIRAGQRPEPPETGSDGLRSTAKLIMELLASSEPPKSPAEQASEPSKVQAPARPRRKKRRGRKPKYDPIADATLAADKKASGLTLKEFAKARGLEIEEVKLAIDRARKEKRKRGKSRVKPR